MLLTSALKVPTIATCLSPSGFTMYSPSFSSRLIAGWRTRSRLPLGPFTFSCEPLMLMSTPEGSLIGFLATRDIPVSLSHVTNEFTAVAGSTRRHVGHEATRCAHDHNAQTVKHTRQVILATIDTQSRTARTFQAVDSATAFEILECNFKTWFAVVFVHAKVSDISLFLQHGSDTHLCFRVRHAYRNFIG